MTAFNPLRDVPLPSKPRQTIYVKPLDDEDEDEDEDEGGNAAAGGGVGDVGGTAGVGGVGGGDQRQQERRRPPQPRLGTPRPKDDCEFEDGMSICVGNVVTDDELYDVKFCLVVNNVVRGAWGAALLNAEYWHWLMSKRKEGGETVAAEGAATATAAAAAATGETIEC